MRDKIRLRLTVPLILVFACSYGFSQSRTPAKRAEGVRSAPFLAEAKVYEESPYVTRVVFKNGMTVLVNEFRAQPLIALQAYVNAGSSHESLQNAGSASLLAAVLCRGTARTGGGTYRQKVQALGGSFSTRVDWRNAQFEIVAPSSQWKQALNVQADALLHPNFDKDAIGLEANLATDAARGSLADASTHANESLLELAFSQPQLERYGALARGSLSALTPEKLSDFYKAHYVPSGMTIVVSGDVRSSDVLNEILRLYVSSASASVAAAPAAETMQKEFRYRALRSKEPFPRILFGFQTGSEKSEDYRTLEILSSLLGRGETSILKARLRDQKGLVFAVKTNLRSFLGSGYFSIELTTDPENIDQSEIALFTELELLKREGPTEAEMARAVAQLELAYWKKLETVSGRADMLAYFEFLGGWKQMDRYLADLKKVKAAEVKQAARRYLQIQNCSLLEYLPASMAERTLTRESLLKTLEGLPGPAADQEQQARIKEIVLALKIPAEGSNFKFSEVQYQFQMASILRGPDMFIREDHTSPLIDLGIFFQGGKAREDRDNAGITRLMLQLMLLGSKEMRDGRLLKQIEIYGGNIQPVVADDYFGFHFSIPSRNFEAGFELLQDAIKSPYFDKSEIARWKRLQSLQITQPENSEDPMYRIVNEALFANFPYALDSAGKEESLARINAESLQSWHAQNVQNRKPVAVVIGDTKGTSLAALFVRQFSGSRMVDARAEEEYARPPEKGASLDRSWKAANSLILTGFQAPPAGDEDSYTAVVLQSYLGELGRLSQEIRDKMGAAYAISVKYDARLRGGSIIISSRANPKNEDIVLKQTGEEIRHLISDPIPYHDFQAALTDAVGLYAIRSQLRACQIMDLVENTIAGRKLDDFRNFPASLREVNDEDMKDLARRILKMDKAVTLRVHGIN